MHSEHIQRREFSMTVDDQRKVRIERMAKLARVYRGWSAAQMSEALGREQSRVGPASGNPKLDLVARLADALDWEIGDVAERVWRGKGARDGDLRARPFADLDARAQTEHRAGEYASMERTGNAMRLIAGTARERAVAANRLAGAYDGVGRYNRMLDTVREGLSERHIGVDVRTMLTINLANAYYTLWNLHEARSIAESVLERFAEDPARTRLERVAEAFGRALRGHARRRMLGTCESPEEQRALAASAAHDLGLAADLYTGLFGDFDDPQYQGLAHTARGGLLEARVAAGELAPEAALEKILTELDGFVDIAAPRPAQMIESCGWWSVFGANVAMRAGEENAAEFSERSGLEQALAICTNKAAEVGEHLQHWPMRERAFTLEWFRKQTIPWMKPADCASWMLDAEDVRVLVGAMGRFPYFRPTGWAILDRAVLAGVGM